MTLDEEYEEPQERLLFKGNWYIPEQRILDAINKTFEDYKESIDYMDWSEVLKQKLGIGGK